MIDAATTAAAWDAIRRECISLLQYLEDAFPYTPPEEQGVWNELHRLVAEQRDAIKALIQLLTRHHVRPPYVGSFPEPFTALNFVSLDFLLPRLVEDTEKSLAVLTADLGRLTAPPPALENLLALKRRHLDTLKGLAARQPAGAK